MNFIETGTTTVTINNVSFNVTIPSVPMNFSYWFYSSQTVGSMSDPNPTFTSTQPWAMDPLSKQVITYGQWNLNIAVPEFNPPLPLAIQNALTVVFTSSNPLLPVVDYNSNGYVNGYSEITPANTIPDPAGYYVSVSYALGNNGQTTTITATFSLFGQLVPNATYSYSYTFTLPEPNPDHGPPPGHNF